MFKLPKIGNLYVDNKIWLVSTYGGVIENSKGGYLAELLMKEIVNKKISMNTTIARVPVRDLDFIQIGTVWKNQVFIKDIVENSEENGYTFDFIKNPPKIIPLCATKIYKAFHYHKLSYTEHEHFKDSLYLSLKTVLGTTVLIPVLEALTSILLPDNKELREKLLIDDMDSILRSYLKESYIDSSKYVINPYITHLDRTLIFLAYLENNLISRQRISKIISSIRRTKVYPKSYTPIPYKHPIVLPFQPSQLTLQGKCKQIDDSTILMYRVTGIVDESDYDVLLKKIIIEETSKGNRKNKKYQYQSVQKILEESDILEDGSPHYQNGHVMTRSKVKRIGRQTNIVVKEEKQEVKAVDRELHIGEDKTGVLSSDDKNSKKGSEKITQIKIGDDREENESELSFFEQVIKNLRELEHNKKIDSYCYIGEDGKEFEEKIFCSFNTKHLKAKKKTWFHKKIKGVKNQYQNRKFLIVKIMINEKRIYLLEIERIKLKESYSGILFDIDELNAETLKSLFESIGENRGRYIRKNEQEKKSLSVSNYTIYIHYANANYICRALKKQKLLNDCS